MLPLAGLFFAAFSVMIAWINPPEPFDGIQGFRCFSLNPADMTAANLWATADRLTPKQPGAPGMPDSAWIWCDDREPIRYEIQFRYGTHIGPRSNAVIAQRGARWIAAGVDTIYFLRRETYCATCFTDPRWSVNGLLWWALPRGDALGTEIVTCEYVNTLPPVRDFGCQHFGYWALRGQAQACP